MPVNPPVPARGAYFIAFLGNDLVGSAALRPLDETTVEVRRMYVVRSARRTGVGRALLARLERTAADLGFKINAARNWESPASCDGIVRIIRFRSYSAV